MSANLKGTVRDKLGSRWARRLRLQGQIPASIQAEDKSNRHFSIDEETFLAARRHHEHLFDIDLGQGEPEPALVRELQWDSFGGRIIHVDFRRVIRGQKTEAEVELEFSGHPKGGVLNHLMTHVKISAFPAEIPDHIEVFVSELEIGHPLLASDLKLPEGVDLAIPPDTQVAVVSQVRAVDLEPTPAEGEPVEGEAAEEGAEKPGEEGAEKPAAEAES